jgi:hypothetical protein
LERIETALESWQDQEPDVEELAARQRWEETLLRFGEMIPEDLRPRVAAALQDKHWPLWRWIEDVWRGRSRLPECLTEEVMRRLLQIRLDGAARDFMDGVCLRCGLQYPLPNYPASAQCGCSDCVDRTRQRAESLALFERLFDGRGCPACGASTKVGDMDWVHLIGDGYWFAADQRAADVPSPDPAEPSDTTHPPTAASPGGQTDPQTEPPPTTSEGHT